MAVRVCSRDEKMEFFLCVLGMVFIIEGIPYFLFPLKWKQLLLKVDEMSESWLRIMGLISIFIGLAIVYLGKK